MALPPHRIHNHEIDSKACAIITLNFSKDWELRDLTGRDFGIDKIAEHFQDEFATSELLMLQIKGTEDMIDENNPRFSLDTKTLLYAEMFSVPFLLLYCYINEPNKCYYVWLQEYIRVRLNYDNPNWREQGTNIIYFPKDNLLGTKSADEHLKYIAKFPKYQESWVGYYLCLNDLCYGLPSVFDWDLMDKSGLNYIVHPIVQKLQIATKKVGEIPKRFIPDIFEQTAQIGLKILSDDSLPDKDTFLRFISNCKTIQSSVDNIATRFDGSFLRFLYETEGTVDY